MIQMVNATVHFLPHLKANSVHCLPRASEAYLCCILLPLFRFLCEWKHPPPSCAEHIVIGRCPESGCSDRLAQAVLLYDWLTICRRSHPQPALDRSGTSGEREEARFVSIFGPVVCLLPFVREWAPVFVCSNVRICFTIQSRARRCVLQCATAWLR